MSPSPLWALGSSLCSFLSLPVLRELTRAARVDIFRCEDEVFEDPVACLALCLSSLTKLCVCVSMCVCRCVCVSMCVCVDVCVCRCVCRLK